jgi:hypothetical protein
MKNLYLRGLILIVAVFLSSCLPAASIDPPPVESSNTLPLAPKAPTINNQVWLNTEKPLAPADLNGKVILIDFWTFG